MNFLFFLESLLLLIVSQFPIFGLPAPNNLINYANIIHAYPSFARKNSFRDFPASQPDVRPSDRRDSSWPPVDGKVISPTGTEGGETDRRCFGRMVGIYFWLLSDAKFTFTGTGKSMLPRVCEYEVEKLRSPACSRQQNAIFQPCIHRTWEAYFCRSLY